MKKIHYILNNAVSPNRKHLRIIECLHSKHELKFLEKEQKTFNQSIKHLIIDG